MSTPTNQPRTPAGSPQGGQFATNPAGSEGTPINLSEVTHVTVSLDRDGIVEAIYAADPEGKISPSMARKCAEHIIAYLRETALNDH